MFHIDNQSFASQQNIYLLSQFFRMILGYVEHSDITLIKSADFTTTLTYLIADGFFLGSFCCKPNSELRTAVPASLTESLVLRDAFCLPSVFSLSLRIHLRLFSSPEVLTLKHESRILGQRSNPVSGSRKSQARGAIQ